METTLNDIPMMCIVADGGPEGAREAFNRLESKLPSLRGRKSTVHSTPPPASIVHASRVSPVMIRGEWDSLLV